MLKRALECVAYPTPISRIKPTKVKTRYYNPDDMADIDYTISQNKIGEIVNWSQLFNSYYWDIYNKGNYDQHLLDLVYNTISMLSSLSQVEIDKAKKFFNIDMDKILDRLKNVNLSGDKVVKRDFTDVYKSKLTSRQKNQVDTLGKKIKTLKEYADKDKISKLRLAIKDIKKINKEKMIRPNFFKYCGEGKEYKFKHFETPMDFLQDILDNIPHAQRTKNTHIMDILINNKELTNFNEQHMSDIKKIIIELDKDIKAIYADQNRNRSEDVDRVRDLKTTAVDIISTYDLSVDSVLSIFNSIYGATNNEYDIKKCKLLLISMLWKAKKDLMIQSFRHSSDGSVKKLIESNNGDIKIWGVEYIVK
jgi:hypothetical protein